jgi:hypothetical protein
MVGIRLVIITLFGLFIVGGASPVGPVSPALFRDKQDRVKGWLNSQEMEEFTEQEMMDEIYKGVLIHSYRSLPEWEDTDMHDKIELVKDIATCEASGMQLIKELLSLNQNCQVITLIVPQS